QLNNFAHEVEREVRTTVLQAVEKEPGKFELHITPDTELLDNVPYKDCDTQSINSKCKSKAASKDNPK
ncbi:hypothetical protein WN55_02636, partial [Dufourea novaeangliae]